MFKELIYLQEDISLIEYNIRQDQEYVKDTKQKLQLEFEKTDLYKKYKSKHNKVKLIYIDEDDITLEVDDIEIELKTKDIC